MITRTFLRSTLSTQLKFPTRIYAKTQKSFSLFTSSGYKAHRLSPSFWNFPKITRNFSNQAADPYKTLGIPRTASKDEIKKAFRVMAKTYHPDKDITNEEKFRTILHAYHILNDEGRRAEHDRKTGGGQSKTRNNA
jgi:DnaJ-class molecular chaperone